MKFGIRELVFLGVMVGLLAAAYLLVFSKTDAKRQAKQVAVDEKVKALADLQRSTVAVKDVDKKIAELQQATAFFEAKLPQAKEIDKVLKEVWQLAEANGLQTKTVKTLQSRKMAGYSEQPIEMSLAGDFDGFYKYMLDLENLPRLTRVTHMALTKINDRDGAMQAQLTLSIFFEPETAPAGPAAAPAGATAAAQ